MEKPKLEPKLPGFDTLAPVQYFDSKAFLDADVQVQGVCDFVLTLALIQNDFKDLWWALRHFQQSMPPFEDFHESPAWGHATGMDNHIHRLQASLLVELVRIIETSEKRINTALFQAILKELEGSSQANWKALINPSSELRKHLKNLRDKVGSHYFYTGQGEQKVLPEGYKKFFDGTGKRPAISYGQNILDSRFYFADAAALGLVQLVRPHDWAKEFDEYIKQVCLCLSGIVVIFLQMRGCKINLGTKI